MSATQMKYDVKTQKLAELSFCLNTTNAFPKVFILFLLLYKEQGDSTFDIFMSKYPRYLRLIEEMRDEKYLDSKNEVNRLNPEVAEIISKISTERGTDINDYLKEYNSLWLGRLGMGSSGNVYNLLEPEKNRKAMLEFLERHPEIAVEDIKFAVNSYFSNLKNNGNKWLFANKSNTFLETVIDGYLPAKGKEKSIMTKVEDAFYLDM